jgi:hypothetical protein
MHVAVIRAAEDTSKPEPGTATDTVLAGLDRLFPVRGKTQNEGSLRSQPTSGACLSSRDCRMLKSFGSERLLKTDESL